jgi:hypothetical protein
MGSETKSTMHRAQIHKIRFPALIACLAATLLSACGSSEPKSAGAPPSVRRLSQEQYRQSIADIFDADIKFGGRFEPEIRQDGLLAVGASSVSITSAGFEQYDGMAREIADQVLSPVRRAKFMPCKPASDAAPDDACAAQFIQKYGRLIFRRPLSDDEMRRQIALANAAAKATKGFYPGLKLELAGLLSSPEFLFRRDETAPDPASPGARRLDAYARAARLSFFLWNTTPDDALLTAAERGDLYDKQALTAQVDRLMASPRLEAGMRAFFSDMLGFDGFDTLSKDPVIYAKFTPRVLNDAREQTLRVLIDQLFVGDGDYRDIFTTRKTVLTKPLGIVERVMVKARDGWEPREFAPDDPRAGILAQPSFLSLYSHPGRSSPTLRGKAVREVFLCQKVPDPPGNVDFSQFNDPNSPVKTARERLTAHRSAPTCAGCHAIMDPIGLGLENFDGAGEYRTTENGAPIDASGQLDGVSYKDAASLGKALHDDPATTSCLTTRLYGYAVGRAPTRDEAAFILYLNGRFAADGYRVPQLLKRIALSDAFYAVSPAPPAVDKSVRDDDRQQESKG